MDGLYEQTSPRCASRVQVRVRRGSMQHLADARHGQSRRDYSPQSSVQGQSGKDESNFEEAEQGFM
jgi:hypothetical protein